MQHRRDMEIVDSDDEKERFEEGDDVFATRPNPLEPQPKKRKKMQLAATLGQASKDRNAGKKWSNKEAMQYQK